MPLGSSSADTAPAVSRGRRSNEEAARTRDRIEQAALDAFARVGFGAASLREIAASAGVTQQTISHHFATKLGLWKAVADRIFGALGDTLRARIRGLDGVSEPERLRLVTRDYLLWTAEHPEVARFMMHEGACRGPRLDWLVERHVGPLFEQVRSQITAAQRDGYAPPGDATHLAYVLIGSTALFSQSAEFELLTGRSTRSPDVIETHTELVLRLLLPGLSSSDGPPEEGPSPGGPR